MGKFSGCFLSVSSHCLWIKSFHLAKVFTGAYGKQGDHLFCETSLPKTLKVGSLLSELSVGQTRRVFLPTALITALPSCPASRAHRFQSNPQWPVPSLVPTPPGHWPLCEPIPSTAPVRPCPCLQHKVPMTLIVHVHTSSQTREGVHGQRQKHLLIRRQHRT